MGVINDFERRLEGAVEGFFARAFRSGLQPIELAKALRRYAEDTQHVTEDGVVVPNVYRFRVSPKDAERLATFGDRLQRELAEVVVGTAQENGWQLRGPALVRLEASDQVRLGTYEMSGRVESVDRDTTGAVSEVSSGTRSRDDVELQVVKGGTPGTTYQLHGRRMVAGRRSDCEIHLEDPTVSREHAAFVRRGEGWWVVDLGSTNGVRVNGSDVGEREIRPGDRIELGEAVLELVGD